MPARALIIAIEDYQGSQSLYGTLEGTNAAALQFREWLVEKKGVAGKDILLCGGEPLKAVRTTGTTRAEVVAEVKKLRDAGKDDTEALYVFFSGHGFSFSNVAGRAPVDVLVAADFQTPEDSGGACIQLQELQEKLRFAMGPGDHYFFVDACRNRLPAESIDVPSLGVVLGRSSLGEPTSYILYSTAPGATGDVRSGFADALTDGLEGKGRAKSWQRGKLWVTFEMLSSYVKSRVTDQEVDSDKRGPGAGLITLLDPPPRSRCEVRVEGADPDDAFTLTVSNPVSEAKEHAFTGPTYAFEVPPFDYYLEVRHPAAVVEPVKPPKDEPADLFDPATVHFRKTRPPAPPRRRPGGAAESFGFAAGAGSSGPWSDEPAAPSAAFDDAGSDAADSADSGSLDAAGSGDPGSNGDPGLDAAGAADLGVDEVEAVEPEPATAPTPFASAGLAPVEITFLRPPGVTVALTHLATGEVRIVDDASSVLLEPGAWRMKARDHGVTLSTRTLEVGGDAESVEISPQPMTEAHEAILARVAHQDPSSGAAWFSETLGPTANRDLGLWLSVLGASRIVGAPLEFSKLQDVPLQAFDGPAQGDAPLYLLAAFPDPELPASLALDGGRDPSWEPLRPVPGMEVVREARIDPGPGMHLLHLQVAGRAPRSWVVRCHAGHATLVVATDGEDGLEVLKYVLPLRAARDGLDARVVGPLAGEPLRVVRALYAVETQFGRRRDVEAQLADDPEGLAVWRELASGDWINPVASCIAGHELLRSGKGSPARVVEGLRKFFPEACDSEAIAARAGQPHKSPVEIPLLLDSVMAVQGEEGHTFPFPLPEHRLDFGGLWSSWTAAVQADPALVPVPA